MIKLKNNFRWLFVSFLRILYIEFWYLSSHSKHFPDPPAFLSIYCYAFFHHIKANLCCANNLESEEFRWIMLNISEATVLEKTDISFLNNYQLPITTCLGEKLHALHSLCGGILYGLGLGRLWICYYLCCEFICTDALMYIDVSVFL